MSEAEASTAGARAGFEETKQPRNRGRGRGGRNPSPRGGDDAATRPKTGGRGARNRPEGGRPEGGA